MNVTELREFQIEFEKLRPELKKDYQNINALRKKFVVEFSPSALKSLDIDDYVIGKGGDTFCNRIENELNDWGNIHGSTSIKFGLYYGKYGNDETKKYRIGKKAFGANKNIAFKNIINSIIEIINNKTDYNILKKNLISPMYKGKILSVYFPNDFLNIFSATHLNYFINALGLDNDSKSEIDKQKLLLDFKNNDKVMVNWTVYEYSKFLYSTFKNPNNELNENNITKELKKYNLKDFPPIESVNFDFIDLNTIKYPIKKEKEKKGKSKIDYSKKSKNNKRIGDRGEQIVLRAERLFLIKNGRKDLAKKIDHVAFYDDSAGYDILSYDLKGNKKYIEVKTTLKSIGDSNVFLSENEFEVSKKIANYYFYIVYEAGSVRPKIWNILGKDLLSDKNLKKEPVLYKLSFFTKK